MPDNGEKIFLFREIFSNLHKYFILTIIILRYINTKQKLKAMKRTMLMTAFALLISAGLTAQNAPQEQNQRGRRTQARNQEQTSVMTQTQSENQNRSAASIQEQTWNQYRNYGEMTSEQKQARNEERKALKQQQRELKRQQKELRKQEAERNREMYTEQERASVKNQGARTSSPVRNAAKVSRSAGQGKR